MRLSPFIFLSLFASAIIVGCDQRRSRGPAEPSHKPFVDSILAKNHDTLKKQYNAIESILTMSEDRRSERITEEYYWKDSLTQGYLLGMMQSNGNLCKGLRKGNTLIQSIEEWTRNHEISYILNDDSSYSINTIGSLLKNSSSWIDNSDAKKFGMITNAFLSLEYIAVEDEWSRKDPKITGNESYLPGLIFKKITIYRISDKKKIQSFFLMKESSDKIEVMTMSDNKASMTDFALRADLEARYSRKRDTLLFSL
jgi:hypothetical protein